MGSRLAVLVAVVALVAYSPAFGSSSVVSDNDGGSGTDAGDTVGQALILPAFGAYRGNMSPRDTDWYAVDADADAPRCLAASLSGAMFWDLALGAVTPSVETSVTPMSSSAAAGVAVPALSRAVAGVLPTPNPAGHTPARPGAYGITLEAFRFSDLGSGDAATGGDAGNRLATATALRGSCTAGTLGSTDPADVFSFTGVAGHTAHVSFVRLMNNPAVLSVVSPSGSRVVDVASGEVVAVPITESGTWSLAITDDGDLTDVTSSTSLSTSSGTFGLESVQYLVGMTDDPSQGCRPLCSS